MNERRRRRFSDRVAIAGIAAMSLLFLGLGYVVLISPQRGRAAELDEEVRAVHAQIEEYRRKASEGSGKRVDAPNLFRLAKAMPDQEDMPGVILELNRIASDAGITFQSIRPQAPVAQTGYQSLPINLIFDGNFYSLNDFLFRLRNLVAFRDGKLDASGRLFSVSEIEFREGPGGFPQILAALSVDAYVFGAAAGASTAPATPAEPTALPAS